MLSSTDAATNKREKTIIDDIMTSVNGEKLINRYNTSLKNNLISIFAGCEYCLVVSPTSDNDIKQYLDLPDSYTLANPALGIR